MTRLCRSLIAFLATLPLLASADDLQLRPDHPDVYVVVRGDTLWDISGRFLTKPWYWPQLWGANPQIANPHLIYPGDRLRLVMTADGPRLIRDGQGHGSGGISPQVRATPIDTAVPAIPLQHIQAFLEEAVVLHSNRAADFAYVASAADEHIAVGATAAAQPHSQASRWTSFALATPTAIRKAAKHWVTTGCSSVAAACSVPAIRPPCPWQRRAVRYLWATC